MRTKFDIYVFITEHAYHLLTRKGKGLSTKDYFKTRSRFMIGRPQILICVQNRFESTLAEMFIGWSYTRFLFLALIGDPTWLPGPIMCSDWSKF